MENRKETMKRAGYKYYKSLGNGEHVLEPIGGGHKEVWGVNKNHASYGIKWRNTHLEFVRSYNK